MNAEVYDRTALVKLVGENHEMHRKLLRKFSELSPAIISNIQTSFHQNDPENIALLTHKLKSSARAVGAIRLADLCQSLERAGKTGNLNEIEELQPAQLANLLQEFEACAGNASQE